MIRGSGNTEALLQEIASLVRSGNWLLFVQGYSFTGFARASEGVIEMPPHDERAPREWASIDWARTSDVRVFCRGQELHAWSLHSGTWNWRLLSGLIRDHEYPTFLAGHPTGRPVNGWTQMTEANGISYYIPALLPGEPALFMIDIEGVQEDTGLVGIVDAALQCVAVYESKGRK